METSGASLKSAAILLLIILVISLNSSTVKAQCSFTLGVIDSTREMTFTTAPGSTQTQAIKITNHSNAALNLLLEAVDTNFQFFAFSVVDSALTIPVGMSATTQILFAPDISASGTITEILAVQDVDAQCVEVVSLIGQVSPSACLETVHALSYDDPVVIGSSAEHEFHLINQSGSNIQITSIVLTDSLTAGFKVTSAFPITVLPHSSDQRLTYTFSPTSDFGGSFFITTFATINLKGDSVGCSSVTVLLIGNVAKPGGGSGIDTNVRPIFPSEARTLAITGNGKPVSEQFTFTNNLNVPCNINRVYMKYGTYFQISGTNPSPTPFTLNADQTMTVTIIDSSLDQTIHTDTLMMDVEHNLQTVAFQVQGVQLATGGVSNTLPQGVAITVAPNPVSNFLSVGISGGQTSDAQVFDILGKEIASAKVNSLWKWDASNLPDGTYIVRVSGVSLHGEHFVSSKRIIVNK